MKKTRARKKISRDTADDMKKEYRFDYRNARPNRFAAAMRESTVIVTLDPDVATVFHSSASVSSLAFGYFCIPQAPQKTSKISLTWVTCATRKSNCEQTLD